MKTRLILLLFPVVFLCGCHLVDKGSDVTSAGSDVYRHYADREEFTVAFLGGYEESGNIYNIVMFRPVDSTGWALLDEEFNVSLASAPRRKAEEGMLVGIKKFVGESAPTISDTSCAKKKDSLTDWNEYDYRPGELVLRTAGAKNGQHYYLKIVDQTDRTLWVLFFDSVEEFQKLIDHQMTKSEMKRSREVTLQLSFWEENKDE